MKVLFYITALTLGGAQRVVSSLANYFVEKNIDVIILTRSKNPDFYSLSPKVKRVNIGEIQSSRFPGMSLINNLRFIITLKQNVKDIQPDIAVSFMSRNNIHLLSSLKKTIPSIISERNYPPMNPLGWIWELLRRHWYPRATMLVSLSEGTNDFFNYIPEEKKKVIYNPIKLNSIEEGNSPDPDGRKKRFIAAGRLHEVKNFPLLIQSFSTITQKIPDWDLVILGEGGERSKLESMVSELNLESKVTLPGSVKNIQDWYSESSVFCLTSNTEGFGNVIVEAMSCGLPVISTDCPTGPSEIIRNDKEGILIPLGDSEKLCEAMLKLALSGSLRESLSISGLLRSRDFSVENIAEQWINTIKECINV